MSDFDTLKEQTRRLLEAGCREGLIPDSELRRRLALVEVSRRPDELDPLVQDLIGSPTSSLSLPGTEIVNVFSSRRLRAHQLPPGRARIRNIFAEMILDLREAPPVDLDLDLSIVFGEVKILMAPHWRVDCRVVPVLADIDDRRAPSPFGSGPTLRLQGRIALGSLVLRAQD